MLQKLIIWLQKLRWSLRTKIGAAFALVLICFIINGIISVLLLFNIRDSEEQRKNTAVDLERLQRYELAYENELRIYSDAVFITKATYVRDTYRSVITNELQKLKLDTSSQAFDVRFARLYTTAFEHFLNLETFIVVSQFNEAGEAWRNFGPDFEKVTALLTEHRKQLEQQRAVQEEEVSSTIIISVTLICAVTGFSLILALFLLFLIGGVFVKPLNKLQDALHKISEGDFDQHVQIVNRDEVGKLSESFSQALTSLQQVLRGVQISESLRIVTGELAVVSQQQSAGSSEQVSALAEVMAAMHELGRTAGQIADNTVQVVALTDDTLGQIERVASAGSTSQQRAHQMTAVIEATLNGVERVGQKVNQFRQNMTELNYQAEAISKVVRSLGGIAEEVHLLALNAAIEAAGAGEYGSRFRVVAHQIKQLAGRANHATSEAQQLIQQVQTSSRTSLSQVEEGQAEVIAVVQANSGLRLNLHELEQSAQQVAEAVDYLVNLAGRVSHQAEEIRQATQQQRLSSEQVLVSAQSAGEIAAQTANVTIQIARNSVQLELLTNQLSSVLNQVKLAT